MEPDINKKLNEEKNKLNNSNLKQVQKEEDSSIISESIRIDAKSQIFKIKRNCC